MLYTTKMCLSKNIFLNLESTVPLREIHLVARDIFSCEGLFGQEKKNNWEKIKICTGESFIIKKY